MRKVEYCVWNGIHHTFIQSVNGVVLSGESSDSHEGSIRDLHGYLEVRVSLIENLIEILEEGYEDFEEACTVMLDSYNYDYDGECPESVIKFLRELRLDHKVSARDIETGSVEYVEVDFVIE